MRRGSDATSPTLTPQLVDGLTGGLALGRTVASLVYGVAVRDPATFAGVAVALTAVALAACVIPARRAARVDPDVWVVEIDDRQGRHFLTEPVDRPR